MRTLKQEIAHQRENGFAHNTIEHTTLLAWLGEQSIMEYELLGMHDKMQKLNYARNDLLNVVEQKDNEINLLIERIKFLEKNNDVVE